MDKLLQIIADCEHQNIPCRYTITPQTDVLWLSVKATTPNGDKIFDYSLPLSHSLDEIAGTLRTRFPLVTVCNIDNRLFIDNLK